MLLVFEELHTVLYITFSHSGTVSSLVLIKRCKTHINWHGYGPTAVVSINHISVVIGSDSPVNFLGFCRGVSQRFEA